MWDRALRPIPLLWTALLLVLGMWLIQTQHTPENSELPEIWKSEARQSVLEGRELYESVHDQLLAQTRSLGEALQEELLAGASRQQIHQQLEETAAWSSTFLRNGELLAWSGFTNLRTAGSPAPETPDISLIRRNQLTLLESTWPFQIGEDRYLLILGLPLEQRRLIPLQDLSSLDLGQQLHQIGRVPVHLQFTDPMENRVTHQEPLLVADRDTVGVLYTLEEDFPHWMNQRNQRSERLRSLFQTLLFLLGGALFLLYSRQLNSIPRIFLQSGILFLLWALSFAYALPQEWAEPFLGDISPDQRPSWNRLVNYLTHALFLCSLTVSLITALTRRWRIRKQENRLLVSISRPVLFSAGTVVLLSFYLIQTHAVGEFIHVALFDLELWPQLSHWIIMIGSGIFLSSILALTLFGFWALCRIEGDKPSLMVIASVISFSLLYLATGLWYNSVLIEPVPLILSISLFFLALAGGYGLFMDPELWLRLSRFRRILILSLVVAMASHMMIAQFDREQTDRQLLEIAEPYLESDFEDSYNVAWQLLTNLELHLQSLSLQDLENRPESAYSRFQRAVRSTLRDEWRSYSFDIGLYSTSGSLLAEYVTRIDSPGGRSPNPLQMETAYTQERIHRSTNRPVIQRISPRESIAGDEFHRGWIPIFDNLFPDRIIAWITASVHREFPDFNRPIRAVLSASSGSEWKQSYHISRYEEGRLVQRFSQGIYRDQPVYDRLSERERQLLENEESVHLSVITQQGRFRELILRLGSGDVLKVSTPQPRFHHHIFSIFRIQMSLMLVAILFHLLLQWTRVIRSPLFGSYRRFRDQLLDGLLLVTLILLLGLVISTQFVMTRQSEDELERELISNLDRLAQTIQSDLDIGMDEPGIPPVSLVQAAQTLDSDAIFYRNLWVSHSTTPQIFEQRLLPSVLPFSVAEFLYQRNRVHMVQPFKIGEEPLLIGYRILRNANDHVTGVVAIPTFLDSPLYREQMLETTSYLLLFYLVIIIGFILVTLLFASHLTRPLTQIREGLDKISSGDLTTQLPVRNQDEIGILAQTYNRMTLRLKELQGDLAHAEREAAWREMARQIAHEIKNPLTPMKLHLQHLQRLISSDPDIQRELKEQAIHVSGRVTEQIESLNRIASDFSSFAQPIREPQSRIELNGLIRSLVDLYQSDPDIQLETHLDERPLHVEGSEESLRRALINVIKNSMEASPPGSTVRIHTTMDHHDLIIEIEDQGSGIPDDLMDQIFQPNFSTKSSGTGLGLAITKKIIEAHHGEIQFHSGDSGQTICRIRFPSMQHHLKHPGPTSQAIGRKS
ncbi:MAG: ATP-binding protein [Balneolaceae bacterium]